MGLLTYQLGHRSANPPGPQVPQPFSGDHHNPFLTGSLWVRFAQCNRHPIVQMRKLRLREGKCLPAPRSQNGTRHAGARPLLTESNFPGSKRRSESPSCNYSSKESVSLLHLQQDLGHKAAAGLTPSAQGKSSWASPGPLSPMAWSPSAGCSE